MISYILNQVEEVTELLLSESKDYYFNIMYNLAEIKLDKNENEFNHEMEYNDAILLEMDNISNIFRINTNSELFKMLLNYFNVNSELNYKALFYSLDKSCYFHNDYLYFIMK